MTDQDIKRRVTVGALMLTPWEDFTGLLPDGDLFGQFNYARSPTFQNAALFAPSYSESFVRALDGADRLLWSNSAGEAITTHDLRLCQPTARAGHYPVALYSAGQALDTVNNPGRDNWMTRLKHDFPGVTVLGDSGGFQIQEGRIKWDAKRTALKTQAWQERACTHAMTLDFPLGGIVRNTLQPHLERLSSSGYELEKIAADLGVSVGYAACFLQTGINSKVYQRGFSAGKTQYLVGLQGRNAAESRLWFNADRKRIDLCQGFAFAGRHHTELAMTFRRIVQMHRHGILHGVAWFHFLGISTPFAAMRLSILQRVLRHLGLVPDGFRISFDSSSPFRQAAHGYQAYLGWERGPDKWTLKAVPIATEANVTNGQTIFDLAEAWHRESPSSRCIAHTYVGGRVPLRDLIKMRPGARPTTSAEQLALLMHHNVQATIEAFRFACRFLDRKDAQNRPSGLKHFDLLAEAVLSPLCNGDHRRAMRLIDEAAPYLNNLASLGEQI